MKIITAIALTTICMLFALTCSPDKPTSPVRPDTSPRAADFIHFDSTTIMVWRMPAHPSAREPFVYWETPIGEPYTDVNGNGQFDYGIDGFIKSSDSTNQDFNHNGIHDGPENMLPYEWDPTIPFDDIDGNGFLRWGDNFFQHDTNVAYAPFVDCNDNGAWDSTGQFLQTIRHWGLSQFGGITRVEFQGIDTLYYFVSDSGFTYYLRFYMLSWYPSPAFVVTPDRYVYEWLDYSYPLLDSGKITPGASTPVISNDLQSVAKRHIHLGDTLTINGALETNLLSIRIDSVQYNKTYPAYDTHSYWEFYFSKEKGLIAFHAWAGGYQWPIEQFFVRTVDSLPILMQKNPRPH